MDKQVDRVFFRDETTHSLNNALVDTNIQMFCQDRRINAFLQGKYKEKFNKIIDQFKNNLKKLDDLRNEIISQEY